ncbi:hypothetical protein SAMN05216345_1112 [Cupriavidus sp. YR651]|uniref:hypothetical protein n=1 Tax=Cupriavidus sp. YR651 TaxID=1855315 RepID=UPI0008842455|nr:hypothetical protein [Cupriavidus sp. YR651]SDD55068.1 hypothetical protein SAMN05216345_1112 [Cupriavidus sp. YR651]
MSKRTEFLLIFNGIIFANITSVCAQEIGWYEKESRKCEFESPVAGNPSAFIRKTNNVGGQYLVAPKSSLNTIIAANADQVKNVHLLTNVELAALRSNLDSLRAAPQALSIVLDVLGKINNLKGALKISSGGLMNWLKGNAAGELKNIDRVYDFVTEGGAYVSIISFKAPAPGEKPLMLELRGYEVQVGTEPNPRRWLSSACLLPIEVTLSRIETKAAGANANNKRLDRQADGTWRMFDITDQKYSSSVFNYIGQDGEYAYFKVAPDKEYRAHMYGGPLQSRSSGAPTWNTLYQVIESQ